ncbi:hypothetical protein SAMN06273572_102425 [Monaibacterium marinum]|uniref:Uncharacterized protein n=1 Tax=Pontivivens marinum TaxID=1690039 RepID=A0A2C9CR93_9RHOB|nr:hypothetical protein [Monaibacterium marinum]SOH93747.1 hypothetical protein SAMN06273572_102425 [Monaibacterium marinum]
MQQLHHIDAELHRLHDTPDPQQHSQIHERAARLLPDPAEQRFHLTHAWVYALVHGEPTNIDRLETTLRQLDAL